MRLRITHIWIGSVILLLTACGNIVSSPAIPPSDANPSPDPTPTQPGLVPPDQLNKVRLESFTMTASDQVELKFNSELNVKEFKGAQNFNFDQNVVIANVELNTSHDIVKIRTSKGLYPKDTGLTLLNLKFLDGQSIGSFQLKFTPAVKVAFVSKARGPANIGAWPEVSGMNLQGLAAADEICKMEAETQNFKGTFYAWLSDGTVDAKMRFSDDTGGWITTGPDRSVLATSLDELVLGKSLVPLQFEVDGMISTDVLGHSSTTFDGLRSPNNSNFCNNWTSDQSNLSIQHGSLEYSGKHWVDDGYMRNCNTTARIYCLQSGEGVDTIVRAPVGAKKVFATSVQGPGHLGTWNDVAGLGLSGYTAGLEICKVRATAASLQNPQNFKPFLSYTNNNAISRYTHTNSPYTLVDGTLIARNLAELSSGKLLAGITLNEFGNADLPNDRVHSGSKPDGTDNVDNACVNWGNSGPTFSSTQGRMGATTHEWLDYHNNVQGICGQNASLICIED